MSKLLLGIMFALVAASTLASNGMASVETAQQGERPDAVTRVVSQRGDGYSRLEWEAPTGGAAIDGYRVTVREAGDPTAEPQVHTVDADTLELTVDGLEFGVVYAIDVAPFNAASATSLRRPFFCSPLNPAAEV